MSSTPPGFEEAVAAFAEMTRLINEQGVERLQQMIPALYGDKINLGAGPAGFVGVLPAANGGTGGTTGGTSRETIYFNGEPLLLGGDALTIGV